MRAICEDHAGGREMEEVDYPPDAYVAPDNPVKRVCRRSRKLPSPIARGKPQMQQMSKFRSPSDTAQSVRQPSLLAQLLLVVGVVSCGGGNVSSAAAGADAAIGGGSGGQQL
ncbi:MAG: hypothetical protein RJA70_2641 [Pseudomonadota bacterium]|jgi:hypothetical protein